MARSTKSRKDSLVINASADSIMRVLLDYESYPEWMSSVFQTAVLERDAEGRPAKVRFVIDVVLDKVSYVLGYSYREDGFDVFYVEGDLEDSSGSYTLKPLEDGSTQVTYEFVLAYQLPNFLKGAMVANLLKQIEERVLKSALYDLKNKVEYG
jgi:uncharacterized membrane protein